ncbi:MAG: type I-B CRISPR-associated protein Cas5b [Bacteroidota bacterium]
MKKILVFEIKGAYAHFKKIYATTSAVSYMIPPKTSLYGYLGAIVGLEKDRYLQSFQNKDCLIGLQICSPIRMQRINTNLRPKLGRLKANDNRKPTTVEYVYKPHYKIYVTHKDAELMANLQNRLQNQQSTYTPTLGLANMLSSFHWVGSFEVEKTIVDQPSPIHSVIPRKKFVRLDNQKLLPEKNHLIEQSLFSIEMDVERNVTERDDIIFDKNAQPIWAQVTNYYTIQQQNVILF